MTKIKQKKPTKTDEDLDVFEELEGEGEDLPEGVVEGGESFAADEGEEDFDEGEDLLELPELGEEPAEVEEEEPAPASKTPAASKPAKAAKTKVPAKAPAKPAPKASPPKKFDQAALDLAPDVPVQVIAVMGKRGISVKELMELRMGQVIDLKRPPNETVDIVVNGKLFARGELVEIDGKLGVRILKLAK